MTNKNNKKDDLDDTLCLTSFFSSLFLAIPCTIIFSKPSEELWINIIGYPLQFIITTCLLFCIIAALLFSFKNVPEFTLDLFKSNIKTIKILPKDNYHILGYISFLYLCFIIFYSYNNTLDYCFYQILRWMLTLFFGWTSFKIYKTEPQSPFFLAFIALTVLFNPIAKISFNSDVWYFIDIATAMFLLFYSYYLNKKKKP